MRPNFFEHIIIGIAQLHGHRAGAILPVELFGQCPHGLFALLKLLQIVVTHDIPQLCQRNLAHHAGKVIKALVPGGMLGAILLGQALVIVHGYLLRVHHHILCLAGMHRKAAHRDHCRGGVEVFIFQPAHIAAVHRVGIGCAKAFQIKKVASLTNFLIRRKGNADFSVGDLFGLQAFGHGKDLGNTSLIIGPQQGGTVACDQRLALHVF